MTAPRHPPDCDGNGWLPCWGLCEDGYVTQPVDDIEDEWVRCDICNGRGEVRCGACEEEER